MFIEYLSADEKLVPNLGDAVLDMAKLVTYRGDALCLNQHVLYVVSDCFHKSQCTVLVVRAHLRQSSAVFCTH